MKSDAGSNALPFDAKRLLMLDVDDTLVHRREAFERWAQQFVQKFAHPAEEFSWIIITDDDGKADRCDFAMKLRSHLRMREKPSEVHELVSKGVLAQLEPENDTAAALAYANAKGWECVAVTNGETQQQAAKLVRTGLHQYIGALVCSSEVGASKPDPVIFRAAETRSGIPLERAWIIGDDPHADIGGGLAVGVEATWVTRGREWPRLDFTPSRISPSCAAAIYDLIG